MKTVMLRNVEVGVGAPKVIVPIVGKTREEILAKAEELRSVKLDVVEWRVDFYEDALNIGNVLETLKQLNMALGDIPILFTFRTKKEGGEKHIDLGAYQALNTAVAWSGNADIVDVEIFSGDKVVKATIDAIHAAGKSVVASSHDFDKTPSQTDLIYRMRKMQDMNADICKVAVMPRNKADVVTLLAATEEMYRCFADRPIMTMSMAPMGVLSRLCGEVFGSCMTFGAVGQVSAPGQIPVEKLNATLDTIHIALGAHE